MTKQISTFIQQAVLTKMGAYLSERLNIDNYYLVESIYLLISEYGEENLEKDYKDYPIIKKKLQKMHKILLKSKTFYDVMENKNFKKKFQDMDKFQRYLNKQFISISSKIPPIQLEIYKLFVWLIRKTSIQNQTVRADMMKVLEYRDNTKINLSKKVKENENRH